MTGLGARDSGLGQARAVLLAVALLSFAGGVFAAEPAPTATAPVSLRAWVDPKEVTIGDPIRYTVEVSAAEGAELLIPVLSGTLGPFTITDFGDLPTRTENGRVIITRWYTLTCFETGDHLVPKPKVQYRPPGASLQDVEGDEVLVGVKSVLPRDKGAADIRDVKPPEEVPFDWRPYGLAAAALALVGGLGWGLFYFLNRPRRRYAPAPRPAHEVALGALKKLHASRLIEAGKFEEYYVQLSAIVRRYLEDGLALRAPEMTTEEFLATAATTPRLAAAQRRLLGEFLTQADLVKFARHLPTLKDTEAAYEAACRFIEETRPAPPQAVPPGAEGQHAAA